jgi:hypothetical protein
MNDSSRSSPTPKPTFLTNIRRDHPDIAERAQRRLEEIIREKRAKAEKERVEEERRVA